MNTQIPILVLILPFFAAFFIPLLSGRLGEKVSKIGITAQSISFLISILTLYHLTRHPPIRTSLFPDLATANPLFGFGLYIDRLSAVMMVLVTGVSTIIHVFSKTYLHQDPGYARFFSLLSLITFALLGLVTSPNLIIFFIFWQLISWLLYLLLAFNYTHHETCRAAFKTFIIFRLGDLFFLAGIFLAYHYYGTLDFPLLFEKASASNITLSLFPGDLIEINVVTAISLLIFVGAMSKSAQFPLHVWLPDTMFGPTPVSALMHAGIVNSGGFLLNRLAPLYGLSPVSLNIVFIFGAFTTVLGASMMLVQNDVKKMLGYSTIAQMGYMIMECGLGAFALAIFHFIAHGLFKASFFLSAGSVIHTTRVEPKSPKLPKTVQGLSGPKPAMVFSRLIWFTGFIVTLILPLIILFSAHDVFHIPLNDEAHGAVIFLFFGWVTSSQAIISIYRMNATASWKVIGIMLSALALIIFTYLFAGELFTVFLYPGPGESALYFEAAALPAALFDSLVILTSITIISVWVFLYAKARGREILMPSWINPLKERFYVLFVNRLYLDLFYQKLSRNVIQVAHKLDKRYLSWLP